MDAPETTRPSRGSAKRATATFVDQLDSGVDSHLSGSGGEAATMKEKGLGSPITRTYGKRNRRRAAVAASAMEASSSPMKEGTARKGKSKLVKKDPSPPSPDILLFTKLKTPVRLGDDYKGATVARPRTRPKPTLQKQKLPSPPTEILMDLSGEMSELTSLSSLSRSGSPDDKVELVGAVAHIPASPPLKPVASTSNVMSQLGLGDYQRQHTWSVKQLGSYVWVLVEPVGTTVFDPALHEDDGKERVWWPGKVRFALYLSNFSKFYDSTHTRIPCGPDRSKAAPPIHLSRFISSRERPSGFLYHPSRISFPSMTT